MFYASENPPENHSVATPDIADGQVQQSNESVTASTVLTPISQRAKCNLNCTDDNDIKKTNDMSSAEVSIILYYCIQILHYFKY